MDSCLPGVTIRMANLESATQVQFTTFQNTCRHCLGYHLLCYVLVDITALPCHSLELCLAGEGTSKLPNEPNEYKTYFKLVIS